MFGQVADMNELNLIGKNTPSIIEDAQSFGATYYDKKLQHLYSYAYATSKPLGCFGDGGAVFTNDENFIKSS